MTDREIVALTAAGILVGVATAAAIAGVVWWWAK